MENDAQDSQILYRNSSDNQTIDKIDTKRIDLDFFLIFRSFV